MIGGLIKNPFHGRGTSMDTFLEKYIVHNKAKV